MGEDDGHTNTIDDEHCLKLSPFLLIISVKIVISI